MLDLDWIKEELRRLAAMPQNPVTVIAPVSPDMEAGLRGDLATMAADPANNGVLPLSVAWDCLHFARFLLLPGHRDTSPDTPSLVFMANVDGSIDDFLQRLVRMSRRGVDQVFGACEGYPPSAERSDSLRLAFLSRHLVTAQTYYVNTLGRTVQQIHNEDHLRRTLADELDRLKTGVSTSAREIRQALIDHVRLDADLNWALTPAPRPGMLWQLKEQLRFLLLVGIGIGALFWAWPLLLAWAIALQVKEKSDREDNHRPSLDWLTELRSTEDQFAHNQFSAVGYLKPGLLRRLTARGVLAIADVATRHVFNRGDLAGIPLLNLEGVDTIHFARWVMIDDDQRLLFASNYDGSLESYMVDFIDKVAWGLNIVFSNGEGYPHTRWLVFDGARDEQTFKDFIGNHQLVTQVWHAPYHHLTAVNIANNEAIRAGLRGTMSERKAQAWLARF